MYNPISTYRIQFNEDFPLKRLREHIDYLSLLGVNTIYASPLFSATPGSGHGYDVINPLQLNPEITNIDEFKSFAALLRKKNIGWLQDTVPNHMAYHPLNKWIMDVLEKGTNSQYLNFFDLNAAVCSGEEKIMVPFLGVSLEEALLSDEISLGIKDGNFTINYYDNSFPVNFETFHSLLVDEIVYAPAYLINRWMHYKMELCIPDESFLNNLWEEFKAEMRNMYEKDKFTAQFIDNLLKKTSHNKERLHEIIRHQHYELCHWQESEHRINFRRFFTVNSLICLKMEDEAVFDTYHKFIAQLVAGGQLQGVRVDHIDGLNTPNEYLLRLRNLVGENTYIVVEKILEPGEDLPEFWPVQGTTGYDFLAIVNNLLTSTKNYHKLRNLYKDITQQTVDPEELIYQNKKMILTTRMHGEWDNIFSFFNQLEFIDYTQEQISKEEMKEALGEFMLACPVYRLYPRQFPLANQNREIVEEIIAKAQRRNPALKPALELLATILLSIDIEGENHSTKLAAFFPRMMQYTGPLMAKGVEDTSMYQYNCFVTHNEVGDAINAAGISIDEFHQQMKERQQKWPLTINTTSTHDTKRGEDVRARLNIISEMTEEWEEMVHQWMQMNQKYKKRLESGLLEPSLSVEYFIYQTLLGTFPSDGTIDENYMTRIDEYLVKALRESKRKVSWRNPDETYENTVCQFVRKLLDPTHDFLDAFVPFQQKVAWLGIINSLTQLTLKGTCPGVPDIYQGTEFWDLTLVDPDNRQPVDYEARAETLQNLIQKHQENPVNTMQELFNNHRTGHIKLWLTYTLLNLRKNHPDLFLSGQYIPLRVTGTAENHLLAFARNHKDKWLIVAVPFFMTSLLEDINQESLTGFDWTGTHVILDDKYPRKWRNVLTGASLNSKEEISVQDLFKDAIPALLIADKA